MNSASGVSASPVTAEWESTARATLAKDRRVDDVTNLTPLPMHLSFLSSSRSHSFNLLYKPPRHCII
jgi:hypothetical protein